MPKSDPHRPLQTGDATERATGSAMPAGVADRAHIVNKEAHEQKVLQGPGSLDPASLEPPGVADARRWLAKRGFEMLVPAHWRFLGLPFDGRGIAFNHNGGGDGHAVELTTWRLADDTPLDHFLAPYEEEAQELLRLGRLASFSRCKLGDVDGLLYVGFGPDSADALAGADPEQLFLATDGTGRRSMSWRGAVKRGHEGELIIVSLSSPIEHFFEARPVYDAMLAHLRIVV